MQWKHASSPPPKKFRAVESAGKVLLTVFFDVQGLLPVESLEHRKSINSDAYCETLRRLRMSIKNKRPGLLTEGVVLLHDITHVHTSPESHKWNWTSSNGRRWTILPTVRTCHPAISMFHGRNI
ncbi:histone-lysine N-methyltransferase SETMAR [Trichonephila clavipes]|nr:histone-lysine N-methyltransferase SETMAR [Trichonephila clavipes]